MKKILIAANDAGGAELVSAWVKANPQYQYFYILTGPATKIFSRKVPALQNQSPNELTSLLKQIDCVITGTSWSTDLERSIIFQAKHHHVKVVAYLDHWTNYQERFIWLNQLCLPDEIWVGDETAEKLATEIFNIPVTLVPNQYLIDLQKDYQKLPSLERNDKINLLYLCEPISAAARWKTGNENYYDYNEYIALQYFLDTIQKLDINSNFNSIRIRLHPSESNTKYAEILASKKCVATTISDNTLLDDFTWADGVVGISSMALYIADYLGKKVYSCIPPGAQTTTLPIKSIEPFIQFAGRCRE